MTESAVPTRSVLLSNLFWFPRVDSTRGAGSVLRRQRKNPRKNRSWSGSLAFFGAFEHLFVDSCKYVILIF